MGSTSVELCVSAQRRRCLSPPSLSSLSSPSSPSSLRGEKRISTGNTGDHWGKGVSREVSITFITSITVITVITQTGENLHGEHWDHGGKGIARAGSLCLWVVKCGLSPRNEDSDTNLSRDLPASYRESSRSASSQVRRAGPVQDLRSRTPFRRYRNVGWSRRGA